MPRTKTTDARIEEVVASVRAMLDAARQEGRDEALAEIRRLIGGGAAPRGRAAGGAAPAPKAAKNARKPRKNPWATMTPEQRKERVRKMLAGRGLKPKGE